MPLAVLAAAFLTFEARAECVTTEDVIGELGEPSAYLDQQDVNILSHRFRGVYGEPMTRSDEALVYEEYTHGPTAVVRVILFADGCGQRDGNLPRQIYQALRSGF